MAGQDLDQQAEISQRIAGLQQFAGQLDAVRTALDAEPPLAVSRNDLTCCLPESRSAPVSVELTARH